MSTPSRFRDSTQIELPAHALDGLRDQLTDEYTVSIIEADAATARIIGSPVEIKAVSGFLSRHGVRLR